MGAPSWPRRRPDAPVGRLPDDVLKSFNPGPQELQRPASRRGHVLHGEVFPLPVPAVSRLSEHDPALANVGAIASFLTIP